MHRAPFPPVGGAPRTSRAPPPFTLPSRKREGGAAGADGHIAGAGAKWASPAAAAAASASPGRPPAAYAAVTAGGSGVTSSGVAGTPQAPLDLGRRRHPPPPGGYARAAGGGSSSIAGAATRAHSGLRSVAAPVPSTSASANGDDWAEEGDAAAAVVPAPALTDVVLPASSRPLPARHLSQDARPDRSAFGRNPSQPPPSCRNRDLEDAAAAPQAAVAAARHDLGYVDQKNSEEEPEAARGDELSGCGSDPGARVTSDGSPTLPPQIVPVPRVVPIPVSAPAQVQPPMLSAPKTLLRRTKPERKEARNPHVAQTVQLAKKPEQMPYLPGTPPTALAAQATQVAPAAPAVSSAKRSPGGQGLETMHAVLGTGKTPRRLTRAKKERQARKPGREVARSIVNTCIQKAINNAVAPAAEPVRAVSTKAHVPLRAGKPQKSKQVGPIDGVSWVPGSDGKACRKRSGRPLRGKRERRALNESSEVLAPGSTRLASSLAGSTRAESAPRDEERCTDGVERVGEVSAEESAWESSSLPVQPTSFADISRAFSNHPTKIPLGGTPLVPSVPAVTVPVGGMKSPWAPSQTHDSSDVWSGASQASGIPGQPEAVSSNRWDAGSQHTTPGVWCPPGDASIVNPEAARESWSARPAPSASAGNSASWTLKGAENVPDAELAGLGRKDAKGIVRIPAGDDGRSLSRRGRQGGPRRKHNSKAEGSGTGKRGGAASHGSARPEQVQVQGAAPQDSMSRAYPNESARAPDLETSGQNSAKPNAPSQRGGRGRGKRRGRGRGGGGIDSGLGGPKVC